ARPRGHEPGAHVRRGDVARRRHEPELGEVVEPRQLLQRRGRVVGVARPEEGGEQEPEGEDEAARTGGHGGSGSTQGTARKRKARPGRSGGVLPGTSQQRASRPFRLRRHASSAASRAAASAPSWSGSAPSCGIEPRWARRYTKGAQRRQLETRAL